MCMKSVENVFPPTTALETGYKVFHKLEDGRYNGVYYGRCGGDAFDKGEVYTLGDTYYTGGSLHCAPWYTRAYHIFTNINDAVEYSLRYHPVVEKGKRVVCKVNYTKVVARGTQYTGYYEGRTCVSALEMTILEEVA